MTRTYGNDQCTSRLRNLLAKALGIILLLTCLLTSLPSTQAADLHPMSLMTRWTPQAQFAGYYVAKAKGFYARRGIDLTILSASPALTSVDALQSGQADFSVIWLSTALRHRSAGADLVNLTQTIPRSSLLFISRRSSGINTLNDLHSRSLGLWSGDLSLPARVLLELHHIQFREVRQSGTVNLFLRGGVDAISAMRYNEYFQLLSAGIEPEELNVISVADEGADFPEDGLYTRGSLLETHPALVAAFVTASREGWRYAFQHPSEAVDIVLEQMRQAQLPASAAHQHWMLEQLRALMLTPAGQLDDQLDPVAFERVHQTLLDRRLMPRAVELTQFLWRPDAQ